MQKLCFILALTAISAGHAAAQEPDFKKDIAPIFESSCVKCHNAEKAKGKLNMEKKETFMKGGEDGVIVKAGKPDDSLLIKVLLLPEDEDEAMPPKGKATRPSTAQIETLKKWITAGAKWPDGATLKAKEEAK